MKKQRLEFVSYNGEYPNLCSGILKIKLDGKIIIFPRFCLLSGGRVYMNKHFEKGEWTIVKFPDNFPEELKSYVEKLVNENVDFGCCGGCV